MGLNRIISLSCLLGLCAGTFAAPAFSAPPVEKAEFNSVITLNGQLAATAFLAPTCETTGVIRQTGKTPSKNPPDYVERGLRKYSSRQLLESARKPGGYMSVITHNKYQMIMKRGNATADVYLDLGMLYLSYGLFDSAVELLDEGLKESPPKGKLVEHYARIHADARRVQQTLTKARDSLCKKGISVAYPSERIFLEAFKIMPKDDHYLAMNLADAFVSAFENSQLALLNSAETNLGFFENPPKQTNVPLARALAAVEKGEWALERVHLQDKTNIYSLTRLMHHVLETIVRKGDRGKVIRSRLPYILRGPLYLLEKDDDKAPQMTDDQKAFLLYGKAMFYFLGPSWKEPMTDDLNRWLTEAIRLAPKAELYADALVAVQANPNELNRRKVAQRELEDKKKQGLHRTVGFTPDNGQQTSPFNGWFNRFQYAIWDSQIKEISKEDERAGRLLRSIGCPGCWGRGMNFWSGTTCPTCNGDGDWSPQK